MEATAVSSAALDLVLLLRGSEPEGLGRPEQVTYQIETAILMGILAEGDRLPREKVLASELGMSPVTLRQSLAALRAKGLIETSRGRSGGSVIRRQIELPDAELRAKLRDASTESLRDLGDLSAAISAMSARLAADRADAQNVQYLNALARAYNEATEEKARRRADSRFHVAVSVASQSSRLTAIALQIQAELMTLWWTHPGEADMTARASEQHSSIIKAIRDRDADRAAKAAELHSRTESEWLIEAHLALKLQPEGSV